MGSCLHRTPPLRCTFQCPVADRAAVTQLNYQLIAQDAQIHRSIAQRLITEMLQRLAMHIVAGHAIQVCSSCGTFAGAARP